MNAHNAELPIELANVCLAVGAVRILEHVSLTFAAGPPTLVLGPNGSGKTTLLRLAMGLIAPSSGRISWGGRRSARIGRRAIVFQRPVLLRRSARNNVRYALAAARVARSLRGARTNELLIRVNLQAVASRAARRLSAGEQQRLALARALARDPRVLFLDEPTASLDPATTKAVEDIVHEAAARGVKVVMATHDLHAARRLAGEIVLLHRGTIIEVGMATQFFTQPKTAVAQRFLAGELLL